MFGELTAKKAGLACITVTLYNVAGALCTMSGRGCSMLAECFQQSSDLRKSVGVWFFLVYLELAARNEITHTQSFQKGRGPNGVREVDFKGRHTPHTATQSGEPQPRAGKLPRTRWAPGITKGLQSFFCLPLLGSAPRSIATSQEIPVL